MFNYLFFCKFLDYILTTCVSLYLFLALLAIVVTPGQTRRLLKTKKNEYRRKVKKTNKTNPSPRTDYDHFLAQRV